MDYLLIAVLVLGSIAFVASLVLYVCSRKFYVKEDSRVGSVTELLPHANCGGCGYAGCSGFASAVVSAADSGSIEGLFCPVGGNETMRRIGTLLNVDAGDTAPKVAVVRCGGDTRHPSFCLTIFRTSNLFCCTYVQRGRISLWLWLPRVWRLCERMHVRSFIHRYSKRHC